MCALESRMSGNYKTEDQKEWLERFGDVWDRIENREVERSVHKCLHSMLVRVNLSLFI